MLEEEPRSKNAQRSMKQPQVNRKEVKKLEDEQPSRLDILATEAVRRLEQLRWSKLDRLATEAARRLEEMSSS